MPKRSNIMRYKAGHCFEIILDISDAPDAVFQSATFRRGGTKIDWPVFEIKKGRRAEFRTPSNLLTLYLVPRLPKGERDQPTRPLEQILGQLHVALTCNDPTNGSPRTHVTKVRVIPCLFSTCDTCEAQETLHGAHEPP
jgi:hypothetical protein